MLAEAPESTDLVACVHKALLGVVKAAAAQQREGSGSEAPTDVSHISPLAVADSALRSLNYHSGVLVLEELLLVKCGDLDSAAALDKLKAAAADKGRRSAGTSGGTSCEVAHDATNQDCWLQLGRLYQALGEDDVLVGLAARAASHGETKEALELELAGQQNKAIEVYNRLLLRQARATGEKESQSDDEDGDDGAFVAASEAEVATWMHRSVECCRQLGDWCQVHDAVLDSVAKGGDARSLWSDPLAREWALPAFLKALCMGGTYRSELTAFLDDALRAPSKIAFLETALTPELALAAALASDWPRVGHLARVGFRRFLCSWEALHPCATAARRRSLRSLERLVELEDVAGLAAAVTSSMLRHANDTAGGAADAATAVDHETVLGVRALLAKWGAQRPSAADPPAVWGDLANDRELSLGLLLRHIDRRSGEEPLDGPTSATARAVAAAVDEHLSRFGFEAAVASVGHGNRAVAKVHIGSATSRLSGNVGLLAGERVAAVAAFNRSAVDATRDPKKQLSFIAKTRGVVGATVEHLEAQAVTVADRAALTQLRFTAGQWAELNLDALVAAEDSSGAAVAAARDAFESFRSIAVGAPAVTSVGPASHAGLALANLCDKLLSQWEDAKRHEGKVLTAGGPLAFDPSVGGDAVATMVIEETLGAIGAGGAASREAMGSLPRLLHLVQRYPATSPAFVRASAAVPCWPFLRWTSQLLAVLDSELGDAVVGLLERLAHEYPQALRYPWRITTEVLEAKATSPQLLEAMRRRTGRLRSLLTNSASEAFVEALHGLQHPELWLKDSLRAMSLVLRSKTLTPAQQQAECAALFATVHKQVLSDASPLVGGRRGMGSYNRDFASKWRKPVEAALGRDGSKVTAKTLKPLQVSVSEAVGKIKAGKQPLGLFSEWLADFGGGGARDEALEVPGGYWWPDSRPAPLQHARLASCEAELLTLGSIRKPKRLGLVGDDEKERRFLVKGGEDLRNDERIEQLLTLMNATLRGASESAAAGLCVRTYSVIPLTTSLGLIEWVPRTAPVKGIIADGLATDGAFHARNQAMLKGPAAKGVAKGSAAKGLAKGAAFPPVDFMTASLFGPLKEYGARVLPRGNGAGEYHTMFKATKATDLVPIFETLASVLPWDVLRRQLCALAPGPEAFLTFRNELARSLAVWSMAGYVLGIGDRHLDNFLLDTSCGAIVSHCVEHPPTCRHQNTLD